MKTKYLYNCVAVFIAILVSASIFNSCIDSDDVGENFYTFTGETMGSFLDKNPDLFSEFNSAVDRVGLKSLLNTYNRYTGFIPTNTAMKNYYDSLQISGLEALTDSAVTYLVYTHFIAGNKYFTEDFNIGEDFSATNMNSRYINIRYSSDGNVIDVVVNSKSTILREYKDIEVENGVVNAIDKVITPSTDLLPNFMAQDERLSLFMEAMEATGWMDDPMFSLTRDDDYVPETNPISIDNKTVCKSPEERKFGYTAFLETNDVFSAAGINSLDDLIAYAKSVYDVIYPDDADITDLTDSRNSLNRFVAYHFVDKTFSAFFHKANMVSGVVLYEYLETLCSNTLMKISNETNEYGNANINNYNGKNIKIKLNEPIYNTVNGTYYLIDGILMYDENVQTMLRNSRIRMDMASLFPEMMTNNIRTVGEITKSPEPKDYYSFREGYLTNLKIISNNTKFWYLPGSNTWSNFQADEMMAKGEFDFQIRLPAVPKGTYEIRFGYTANQYRGIIQFYVNGVAQGIPLNMKKLGTDATIGWIADTETTDDGVEIDKMMKNRGYLKGGNTYYKYEGTTLKTAREMNGALRRVVYTGELENKPTYIRFKNVSENTDDQFMLDFFEIVPKSLYGNPDSSEPRD